MKKTIITIGAVAFLIAGAGASVAKLEISMTDKGPVLNGEVLQREEEKNAGTFVVRTRQLKAGGTSLLVKAGEEEGEVSVFGRKVKLKKNGQYQVKWDAEEGKVVTAEADAEVSKWVSPPDLYHWFSGKEKKSEAEGENEGKNDEGEVIRLPRKIVFIPGEQPPETSDMGMGMGEGAVGNFERGGYDETLDLPPLRDIREKLGRAGHDFTKTPRPSAGATGSTRYYPSGSLDYPRNGADMAINPLPREALNADDEYVVQPGDTIDLNFYRVQRVTVDMRGDIRVVSSVGSAESVVRAAGKTPREISEAVLHSGLNFRAIPDPALKVNISRFSDRSVVVLGRVNKPGKIPLDDGEVIGISGILKKAGGVAGGERGAIVYVKRGDKVTKADLGTGDDTALSLFRIMPGDIVTVNKK